MNRIEILKKLINLDESIEVLQRKINSLSWDFEEDLVFLNKNHLKKILNFYILGKINKNQLEKWANLIECREDIGFENENLKDIIFELANPQLYGDINKKRVKDILKRLQL